MRKHLLGFGPIAISLLFAGCTPLAEKGWFRPSQGSSEADSASVESDKSVSATETESQLSARWLSGVMGWSRSQKARAAAELAAQSQIKVVFASDSRHSADMPKSAVAKATPEPVHPSRPVKSAPPVVWDISRETKVAEAPRIVDEPKVEPNPFAEPDVKQTDIKRDEHAEQKTEAAVVSKPESNEPVRSETPSAIMRGTVRRPVAGERQSTPGAKTTTATSARIDTPSTLQDVAAANDADAPPVFRNAEFARDFSSILQAGATTAFEPQQVEQVPPAPVPSPADAYPNRKVEQKQPTKIDAPAAGNKSESNSGKIESHPEKQKSVQIGSDAEFFADHANPAPCQTPCPVPCPDPCSYDLGYCNGCLAGTGLRCGIACGPCGHCQDLEWDDMELIPWESLGQGEYIGPSRAPHVPEYRLRVDDVLDFVYRLTLNKSPFPYKINVGDTLRIESLTAANLQRDLIVQPDGTITVRQLGQIPASGRTIDELRADLDERYKKYVNNPSITVTPLIMNSQLQELRATVDARAGAGGQSRQAKVTPEGTIQLPAIGSVPAQGLTLTELKAEVEQRYNDIVVGLEITPILAQRAPRFVYVTGEVLQPGRYTLEAPTTVIQDVALAGNWNVGADLHNVVILRRDDNWQLMATKVDLHKALFGKEPCPEGEIWLRDSDIVLLPKSPILWTDNLIDLFFTRGLYGVFPIQYSVVLSSLSKL